MGGEFRARVTGLGLWTEELDYQQCCHQQLVFERGDLTHLLCRQCRIWGQKVDITTSALPDLNLDLQNRGLPRELSSLQDGRSFVISSWEF